jgi:hypothetical protein
MLGKRFVTPASARKADSQPPAVKTYKYCMLHNSNFGFLFCLHGFCTESSWLMDARARLAYGCKLQDQQGCTQWNSNTANVSNTGRRNSLTGLRSILS